MNTIVFNTLGIVQSYNSQEEIIIREESNNVKVTITKQFPTPGYSIAIDKILREKSGYRIYFNILSPSSDAILPQVITYKTLTLNIDKSQLGKPPYNFILDGFTTITTN
ncbi:protease complex subunit PrcB family protein [Tissierella creatinini]|nr:protease complex subunit PrcB family protein [Tissierella creatinini]TJX63561.1 protease complex subunit PrcB family protein [Soehngenia saccharolytica]